MNPAGLPSHWRLVLLTVALIMSPAARLSGQATTVSTAGGALRVQAPGFAFIEGPVLEQLRDGRSLLIEVELTVLAEPGRRAVTAGRQRFNLSFDLWEERFAVSRIGNPPRSVSHLTSKGAEAWCLENLAIPLAELGRLAPDAPFWVRLEYRVDTQAPESGSDADAGFTLRRLIDVLSQRRQVTDLRKSMEAGPFRLSS